MSTFILQLKGLVAESSDDQADRWKPNETELNAALAFVAGIKPRNEAEAALAAQMVVVHWMQMRLSRQAMRYGSVDVNTAAVAGKMARTYTMQLDALAKIRGKQSSSRQTIKVRKELHQHVHYHHHGEGEEVERQCHAADHAGVPVVSKCPRCQARTREGRSCRSPAVVGKRVCRMHGGTNPGAPRGERNGAYRHGGHTSEAVAIRRAAARLLKEIDHA
jgi:hypothetical protein